MSPENKVMYLKHIHIENFGPLDKIDYDMPFSSEDASPIPLVLVGGNGAGKTVFIAQIVDALIEIQKIIYNNVVSRDGLVSQFFVMTGGPNVKLGKKGSITFAAFSNGVNYVAHSGNIEKDENLAILRKTYAFLDRVSPENGKYIDFNGKANCSQETRKNLEEIFNDSVYSYFPASRTESPFWLNKNSLINLDESFSFAGRISGKNEKSILCETIFDDNIKWLFNVMIDSLFSLEKTSNGFHITDIFLEQKLKNQKLIETVEKIFSIIFSKKIKIIAGQRHFKEQRLQISDVNAHTVLIDNLAKLSLGQKILLNIFLTIVRYGDNINLDDISKLRGIVIIDEIDSHLHIEFQKNILPQLLGLFPKIQFIVTTHSPFFIMGMAERGNNFKIMELPDGKIILHNEFSEIQEATKLFFPTYEQTYAQLENLKKQIAKLSKPIVLTEGRSDAIILRNAWGKLYPGQECPFEIIPVGHQADTCKRCGGAKELNSTLVRISSCNLSNKIVGLFDNDKEGYDQFKGLQTDAFESYRDKSIIRKHLKNDIWGMLLPVPVSRKEKYEGKVDLHRRFVIELYFADEILRENDMFGAEIAPNTEIYEISHASKKKIEFAELTAKFDKAIFVNFQILFDELLNLLNINLLVNENIPSDVSISIDIQSEFNDK